MPHKVYLLYGMQHLVFYNSHTPQAGYKEREDRIADLEELINDQVTELDKMKAEMKQTTADKQLLEEDYQAAKVQNVSISVFEQVTL